MSSRLLLEKLKKSHRRLHALLSSHLTYPKTLVGVAKNRFLREEEVQRACIYLDACLSALDTEMLRLILRLEDPA